MRRLGRRAGPAGPHPLAPAQAGRGEVRLLRFHREIPNKLSAESLWRHLELAFRDSSKSPIWPGGLETVRSEGLRLGATVQAVYKLPWGGESQARYRIAEYDPAVRKFRYEPAEGHPLQGGATVEVRPTPTGCLLVWRGEYRPRRLSLAPIFFRFYFERRFFGTLEENLRLLYTTPLK